MYKISYELCNNVHELNSFQRKVDCYNPVSWYSSS